MTEEIHNETPATSDPEPKATDDMKGMLAQFEELLDEYMVKKAPFHIPANGKEFLAKVSPYIIMLFALLTIPVIIAGLGLTAVLSPFAMMGGYYHFGVLGLLSGVLALVALVIEISAIKGLFKRTHASWRLLYYASLVVFVSHILSFNIVGGIVGSVIGWYVLFQMKELYKNV